MKSDLVKSKAKPIAIAASAMPEPVPAPAPSRRKRPLPASAKLARIKATKPREQSKQDIVVGMLRQKRGTTAAAVMKATGWQKHSVLGFFSGVVRKKLGLKLLSDKSGGGRIYRIVAGKPAKALRRRPSGQPDGG